MSATHRVVATAGPQGESLWLDVPKIRADFPALQQKIHGQPLVYLDGHLIRERLWRQVYDRWPSPSDATQPSPWESHDQQSSRLNS